MTKNLLELAIEGHQKDTTLFGHIETTICTVIGIFKAMTKHTEGETKEFFLKHVDKLRKDLDAYKSMNELSLINDILKEMKDAKIEFKIGGSYSLKLFNVISRNPKDLDLVIGRRIDFDKIREIYGATIKTDYEDSNIEISNQLTFVKNGVIVDVFLVDNEDYNEIMVDGEYYEVAHPKYAINAKMNYIKNNNGDSVEKIERLKKHYSDVLDYKIWKLNKD